MSAASQASMGTKPFTFDRSFDDPSKVYLPGEKYGPSIEVAIPKTIQTKTDGDGQSEDTPVEDTPPPPPEKIYTEADLEAAREDGQVAGHTAALEEAETAREHYAADALNLISQGLGELQDQQSAANRDIGESALRMVYAVIEKVVPTHAQAHAVDSVETLVKEVLPLVYEEPKLVVRTHNMISEDVEARLAEVMQRSNFLGDVSVVPDYELQPGDCRVEWSGGGADRNEARLWKEIRSIVDDNVGLIDEEALETAEETAEEPGAHVTSEADSSAESDTNELAASLDSEPDTTKEPDQLATETDVSETEAETKHVDEPDSSGS